MQRTVVQNDTDRTRHPDGDDWVSATVRGHVHGFALPTTLGSLRNAPAEPAQLTDERGDDNLLGLVRGWSGVGDPAGQHCSTRAWPCGYRLDFDPLAVGQVHSDVGRSRHALWVSA